MDEGGFVYIEIVIESDFAEGLDAQRELFHVFHYTAG
jgi:hypothetical protein